MKILNLFFFVLTFSSQTFALHSPPDLTDSRSGEDPIKLVFVDFSEAESTIIYDLEKNKVSATTTIKFYQPTSGKVIFDLVENPSSVLLDNRPYSSKTKTISESGTTVRYIDHVSEKGSHELTITNEIEKLVNFDSYNKTVRSAFWMSDLGDRRFLESYLPTNLEYDQYQNNFTVKIINTTKEHNIHTNGKIISEDKNIFFITYPAHYTSSSIYFHLTEKEAYNTSKKNYKSIDGRNIPITVYSSGNTQTFMVEALKVLKELEKDYGAWPHPFLIIYGAGSGGMEYAGATRTSFRALGHELHHGYFARSMMPSRGNNGWIDEALASWRDRGYGSTSIGSLTPSKMGAHSVYRRTTDRDAYSKGARFMAYLNYRMKEFGGLRPFLKKFFEKYNQRSFVTQNFKDELEAYTKINFDYVFNPYIFGKGHPWKSDKHQHEHMENPMHPKTTYEEELRLL